jgi:hypothetical protein
MTWSSPSEPRPPTLIGNTGSNLVDAGRAAAHDHPLCWVVDSTAAQMPGVVEATRKACGVLVARLPEKSWAVRHEVAGDEWAMWWRFG